MQSILLLLLRRNVKRVQPSKRKSDHLHRFRPERVVFVCRQILRSTLEKLNVAAVYGTYWDNGIEIDIAALDIFSKTLYLGECKFWKDPVDSKVLTSLMSKTDGVEEFRKYTVRRCVFSVSGYTDAAMELAKEEDFILFDNGKLVDGVLPEVLYIDRLS